MGALVYLDDTQIRVRSGKNSSMTDACANHGCRSSVYFNLPLFDQIGLPVPFPKVRNEIGEWGSYVHFMPRRVGNDEGETIVTVQDSNVFMTAAITYPMFLFDETNLPKEKRVIEEMRRMAIGNIKRFKRGDAYNFWIETPGETSFSPKVGPYNIPVAFTEQLAKSYLDPRQKWFWDRVGKGLELPPKDWLQACLNEKRNPYGADALFNIPNDADDSAMSVAIQRLHSYEYKPSSADPYYRDPTNFQVDVGVLDVMEKYRDHNRVKEDGRDAWKGKNSGAFLTWLKDENLDIFGTPETGVIPLEVNNVDCVVNANSLFALALNGRENTDSFGAVSNLMLEVIKKEAWVRGGLYYPQKMVFPYAVSRAFRDANIRDPRLRLAMGKLLKEIIADQRALAKRNSKLAGAFPGGFDETYDLSTALGLVTLLNVGRDVAVERGIEAQFDRAIDGAVRFLLNSRKSYRIKSEDTFNRDKRNDSIFGDNGYKWNSGLFFSASFWDLATWRSEAYTVSIVLEALTKYLMAYDLGDVNILEGRRVRVHSYTRDASKAKHRFLFDIY